MDVAALDAAASEPHGVGVDMMVAADVAAWLPHGGTAELPTPDHQRVVEHAAALQVLDKGGAGLIDLPANLRQGSVEVELGTVMVPVGVDELDVSASPRSTSRAC